MRPWSTTSSKQWGQMDLAEWEDLKLGAPELVDELAVRDNGSIVAEWGPLKSFIVVQLLSRLFATPWTAAHQSSLSFTIFQSLLKLTSIESMIPPNHLIQSPSSPALNRHQSLFQRVGSSHQVAKILELQFQHQSFQWIARINFL